MKLSLSDICDSIVSDSTTGKIAKYFQDLGSSELENFQISSNEPLGYGHQGIVFPHKEDGKVVKITLNSKDYDNSNKFGQMSHITPVHSAQKIKLGEEDGFLIIMDKMEKLPDDIYEFLHGIMEPIKDGLKPSPEENLRMSKKFYKELRNYYSSNKSFLDGRKKRYLRQMLKFIKETHSNNMHFWDRHICQFMMDKKGKLKLVDLAAIAPIDIEGG